MPTSKRWTTDQQFKFLNGHIAGYLEEKAKKQESHSTKNLTQYIANVIKEFRVKWPEVEYLVANNRLPESALTTNKRAWPDADRDVLKSANADREKASVYLIQKTGRSAAGLQGARRQSTNPMLVSMLRPQKRNRMNKPTEMYGKMYPERVRALMAPKILQYAAEHPELDKDYLKKYDLELEPENDEEKGERSEASDDEDANDEKKKVIKAFNAWAFTTWMKTSTEAWKSESAETQALVLEAIAKERAELSAMLSVEKEALEREPEKRKAFIAGLVNMIELTCEEIYRLSGWSTVVMTGGPNPAAKQITVQTWVDVLIIFILVDLGLLISICYGETVETRESFMNFYAGHKTNVHEPFLNWLYHIYPDYSPDNDEAVILPLSAEDLLSFSHGDKSEGLLPANDLEIEDNSVGLLPVNDLHIEDPLPPPSSSVLPSPQDDFSDEHPDDYSNIDPILLNLSASVAQASATHDVERDPSIPSPSPPAGSGTATIVVCTTDTPTNPQERQDDYVFPSNLDYQAAVESPLLELEAEAEHASNLNAGDSAPEEQQQESAMARLEAENAVSEGESVGRLGGSDDRCRGQGRGARGGRGGRGRGRGRGGRGGRNEGSAKVMEATGLTLASSRERRGAQPARYADGSRMPTSGMGLHKGQDSKVRETKRKSAVGEGVEGRKR
ncbi:hypothetical protein H0H92_003955, partial [Tricholoma furcatifolium]